MKLFLQPLAPYCIICKCELFRVVSTPERIVWSHGPNSCENANKVYESPQWTIEAKEI